MLGVGVGVSTARMRTQTPSTVVRLEDETNGISVPSRPLSLSKPSWVVRTELGRNRIHHVFVCQGTGKVDCYHCRGKGRTTYVNLATLPKGKWPKWCRDCGDSGLSYCSRCHGTEEYRYVTGFHFLNRDSDDQKKQHRIHIPRGYSGQQTAADRFLKGDQLDSDKEQDI